LCPLHDHKFDPLLQKDYFALRSFFTPLLSSRRFQTIADVATRTKHAEQQTDLRKKQTQAIRSNVCPRNRNARAARERRGAGVKMFHQGNSSSRIEPSSRDFTPYELPNCAVDDASKLELKPKTTEMARMRLRKPNAKILKHWRAFDGLKPRTTPNGSRFVASDVRTEAPTNVHS